MIDIDRQIDRQIDRDRQLTKNGELQSWNTFKLERFRMTYTWRD